MDEQEFLDSREEMEQILREEVVGYLGLSDNGKPYVVPLNYAYMSGKIVFHCALTGQKLDAIRRNPHVCFTVGRQVGDVRDHANDPVCHPDSDSVICYGMARLLEDHTEREAALNAFNRRFRPSEPDLPMKRIERCMAVEITITKMTGRRERARHRAYWRSTF
ncbi:MAG TPA: pyridoxamine 5'-phosphate oxidase family protein [Chloroflexota bacterium]|nr:pyridoxamine 5'-phosphate oxidase family protein [Chloroflexota bacterium]